MDWLAFAGSILGGLIGGLFIYLGVRLTLKHEWEKKERNINKGWCWKTKIWNS